MGFYTSGIAEGKKKKDGVKEGRGCVLSSKIDITDLKGHLEVIRVPTDQMPAT